ncbi:Slam-dependent surface lipoprotein [Thauera sp. Sel9]|uniref:Slam-dependent surface lipoprotein n=1 Tax=Thauera sp. Sel9 TaxID=2974299 RepID=UPI0021E172C3|nr:Slam-dependent surface lipoprotein [Thauera sp. Sel9]
MHFQKLAIASAMMIVSASALAQNSSTHGGASTNYVNTGIGASMGTGVGISMPGTNPPTTNPGDQSAIVSFAGGPIMQANAAYASQSGPYYYIYIPGSSGPIQMAQTWRADAAYGTKIYAYRQINNPLPTFPHFGGEVVAKVKDHEVYFGEWAPKGSNTGTGNNTNLNLNSNLRTVFYVGENPTASMPNLVNAKYDVVGVRRYNPGTQAGVHTGTLTANYSISSASGTLTGSVWNANFNGTTIASNGTFQNTNGTITGRFYGASASALAGIYNPSGHANDMAFGGAKRP